MKNQHDTSPDTHDVNPGRRRLTKAGLAAPAVLGVLASRPVLGQSLHHCTPSGHISGFASPNPNAAPCNVGRSVSYYAGTLDTWPPEFLTANGKPRLFKESPNGMGLVLFADAYQRVDKQNNITPATVWDVLKGYPVKDNGNPEQNMTLVAKSANVDLELGQQAVAACMNALKVFGFPIGALMVVKMFNGVFINGTDNVTSTNNWDKEHLKSYFRTLQG
ncbi:MAG TPA: hypothetical protein DCE18_19855 [Syntrophobacteraceae bacterium]|jgi:hypothetical protein|nr:hypothetical protein [Syntrophobacteraceae bacterium]